jgi:hypothetical protein
MDSVSVVDIHIRSELRRRRPPPVGAKFIFFKKIFSHACAYRSSGPHACGINNYARA